MLLVSWRMAKAYSEDLRGRIHTAWQEGPHTRSEWCLLYVREVLCPGAVVVMDNLSAHYCLSE